MRSTRGTSASHLCLRHSNIPPLPLNKYAFPFHSTHKNAITLSHTMASHWKSTPSYWCKFCSSYVRDTPLERKSHESSIKHQNNIQRSLRELHKTKEREDRDKQRAKDEVARLNGLVSGKKGGSSSGIIGAQVVSGTASEAKVYDAAARKAHAEQLAAMGVQLPDELKKEVTGVGEWETISSRVVNEGDSATGMSMADILKQESVKREDADSKGGVVKGVHKRRADEDEDVVGEEGARKKAAWGSRLKVYPGKNVEADEGEDLDALLSDVTAKKRQPASGDGNEETESEVKAEPTPDDGGSDVKPEVKPEDGGEAESGITAPPIPVFKKRKAKK